MGFTVLEAEFVRSAPSLRVCEEGPADLPEIAFAGRSNVGKSTLIAELLGKKKLVRTSKTPGATRKLNFFEVRLREDETREERRFRLVDLPGYGWARLSKGDRAHLSDLLSSYLSTRAPLVCVCQLIDIRHSPTAEDLQLAGQLSSLQAAHILVATKADKLALSKRKPARKVVAAKLDCAPGSVTLFSAPDHVGRDELLARLWSQLPAVAP